MSVLLSCLLLAACASSEPSSAAQGDARSSGDEVAADELACQRYSLRLCEALGERSDSCRAALTVVSLMPPSACAAGVRDWSQTVQRIASMRAACEQLADQVCEALGDGSEGCRALRADMPSIPPGHCPTLLREAPQLIARIQEREQLAAPLDAPRWEAVSKPGAPEFGVADARVVLVVFSDFQCPYCARAAETIAQVRTNYGERVRFVFRQFPLPFHEHAHGAAQAALAAFEQGKFWEYHDLLFANQGALDEESLERYARGLELDMDKFRAAAAGDATAALVAGDVQLGNSVHVRGTPSLFINGERIENALDYESVAAAIDAALDSSE